MSQMHNGFMETSADIRQSGAYQERGGGDVLTTGHIQLTWSLSVPHTCSAKPQVRGGLALLAACFFRRGALAMLEMSIPCSEVGRDLQWQRAMLLSTFYTFQAKASKHSPAARVASWSPQDTERLLDPAASPRDPLSGAELVWASALAGNVSAASVRSDSVPRAASQANGWVLKPYLVKIRFYIVSSTVSHPRPRAKDKTNDVTLPF